MPPMMLDQVSWLENELLETRQVSENLFLNVFLVKTWTFFGILYTLTLVKLAILDTIGHIFTFCRV